MKKIKIGLLGKIIIAIMLGIAAGLVSPEWIVRIFLTFNGIFSQFLGFAIPLIILGLVTTAIADIGNGAGKMLLLTVTIAYGSTVLAGIISYLTGASLFPSMINSSATLEGIESAKELASADECDDSSGTCICSGIGTGIPQDRHIEKRSSRL